MAILFDLDGTLLDTAPDFVYSVNVLRSKAGLNPLPLETLRASVSDGLSGLVQTGFGIDTQDPKNSELSQELLKIYQENICRFTQPFPGILSLLTFLEQQKIPWGIVTNKHGYLTDPILTQLDLKTRAACVVSGDTTPFAKPHPAPLFHACESLNITPESCVYIGDAKRDIDAGNAAGMTTIVALFGYIADPKDAATWGAHHAVVHPDELIPWIKSWKKL